MSPGTDRIGSPIACFAAIVQKVTLPLSAKLTWTHNSPATNNEPTDMELKTRNEE
jgi:hypothetical protein